LSFTLLSVRFHSEVNFSPAWLSKQVALRNIPNRFYTGQAHGHLQLIAEVLEDGLNSHPTSQRQPIKDGPPDGDGIGPERQRFEDVLTAARAS